MSETKWTKHPSGAEWTWGWNGDQCNVWGVAIILGQDTKTREANARLISAAPDLYEALANMVKAAEFEDWDGRSEEYTAAVSALAKARGEQP